VYSPACRPLRHAEILALEAVPLALRGRAAELTCYATLEQCAMCFGALVTHRVGRVVFGARDPSRREGPGVRRALRVLQAGRG